MTTSFKLALMQTISQALCMYAGQTFTMKGIHVTEKSGLISAPSSSSSSTSSHSTSSTSSTSSSSSSFFSYFSTSASSSLSPLSTPSPSIQFVSYDLTVTCRNTTANILRDLNLAVTSGSFSTILRQKSVYKNVTVTGLFNVINSSPSSSPMAQLSTSKYAIGNSNFFCHFIFSLFYYFIILYFAMFSLWTFNNFTIFFYRYFTIISSSHLILFCFFSHSFIHYVLCHNNFYDRQRFINFMI